MTKIDYLIIFSFMLITTTISFGYMSEAAEIRESVNQTENDNGSSSRQDTVDKNTDESTEEWRLEKWQPEMDEVIAC